MSKERLENAKEIIGRLVGYGTYDDINEIEVLGWLIEQAERVQELEEAIADYAYEIGKRKRALNRKYEQNKRYREALEFYADRKTYERRHDPYEPLDTDINDDRGGRARKALEGDLE